jgi:sulfate adenylyltransferase subunit 2
MLKCAEKAFGVGRIPYPLLMIDTGHNFPEVTDFRDFARQGTGAELIVRSVEDSMARGTVRLAHPGEAATCTSRSRCSKRSRNSASTR